MTQSQAAEMITDLLLCVSYKHADIPRHVRAEFSRMKARYSELAAEMGHAGASHQARYESVLRIIQKVTPDVGS